MQYYVPRKLVPLKVIVNLYETEAKIYTLWESITLALCLNHKLAESRLP